MVSMSGVVDRKSELFIKIASTLIFFIFANILITSVFFFFNIPMSVFQLIIASIGTIIFLFLLFKKQNNRDFKLSLAAVGIIILSSIFISSITIDNTYDSLNYHKLAVGAIKNGWNPVYQDVADFNKSYDNPVKLKNSSYEIYAEHYAKAHWIYAANIYKLTGNIESGRSMVLIISVALFLISLGYFITKFKWKNALCLSFIITLNPITITQVFSYYNDCILGILIFILLILLTMMIDKKIKYMEPLQYFLLFMVLTILINIKFSGLIFAAAYCGFYLVLLLLMKGQKGKIIKYVVTGVLASVIGIFVIGFSAYPKNYIDHGDVFYPLNGSGKIDIMTRNQPKIFNYMSRLDKLYISIFSRTDDIFQSRNRDPELKIPFLINAKEVNNLKEPSVRMGGYGVWFSGILIISVLVLIFYCWRLFIQKKWAVFCMLIVPLLSTIILPLLIDNMWWARYYPHIYVIPVLALVLLFINKKWLLSNIFCFMVLFNVCLTGFIYLDNQVTALGNWETDLNHINTIIDKTGTMPAMYPAQYSGLMYNIYDRYHEAKILAKEPIADDVGNSSVYRLKTIKYVSIFEQIE